MSCLDLCYSVKLKRWSGFKDEKNDETIPVLLHDLVKEADSEQSPLAPRIATDSADTVCCVMYSGNKVEISLLYNFNYFKGNVPPVFDVSTPSPPSFFNVAH